MDSIHLNDAKKIMNSGQVSLDFVASDGKVIHVENCVALKPSKRTGTRTIKLIPSGEIRRIRDALILRVNDIPVYL